MMENFKGFSTQDRTTIIPNTFFTKLLSQIEDIHELKILLYFFWHINQSERQFPFITKNHYLNDAVFIKTFGETPLKQQENLVAALNLAIRHHALLPFHLDGTDYYFLNSPKGQAGLKAAKSGKIEILQTDDFPVKLELEQSNIFQLYEENIGPITPIIADTLKDIEDNYSPEWIREAFTEALKNNVRKLRYIEVILKNWQEAGKNDRTDRRSGKKTSEEYDPDKYTDGEYSDFINR